MQPSTISSFVGGGQAKYRQMPNPSGSNDRNVVVFLHVANRQTFAKAILSFLGFIVQEAIVSEIDPDTAARLSVQLRSNRLAR
jgi:hypothetical protein